MGTWRVTRLSGTPAELHGRPIDPAGREVARCDASAPAVVLGSTQPPGSIDEEAAARAWLAVVRRRSGGGAVVVRPDRVLWVDVSLPAGDTLWDDDVGRSFGWLGRAWAAALESLGVPEVSVHAGPARHSPLSPVLCFAGTGPGEVSARGRKVVGISQRRIRAGARFHCAALLRWDPAEAAALLVGTDRGEAEQLLSGWSTGVEEVAPWRTGTAEALWSALVDHLPE